SEVDLVANDGKQTIQRNICWRWLIEQFDGKIRFEPFCFQKVYLYINSTGFVGLSSQQRDHLFLSIKNGDGSWSLLSESGYYLCAAPNKSVYGAKSQNFATHFWLKPWHDIACCDCPDEFEIVGGKCGGFYTATIARHRLLLDDVIEKCVSLAVFIISAYLYCSGNGTLEHK
ncbi:hypothetical protein PMAYCL1PPCAC_33264, partial [Pristionchus mayeri]